MKTTFTPSFIKSAVIATTAMFSLSTSAQTAVTIFSEDFGTASSTKSELIEDHVWETNSSDMFSWTVDDESVDGINVRNNNESDYEGASGSGNLYFKGKATFTISGINTAGYEDIVLTFGVFGKNEGDINAMTLTINDGTTETTVSLADMNLDATAGTWSVATVSDIPATATLTLTFASTLDAADDGGIRLDDITITGIKTTDDGDTDDGDDNGDDSDDGDDSGTGDGDTDDGDGTTTLFYEDFGTASSTKSELIEDHVWETNSSDMFSWTVDDESVDGINVRNNNESDYEGASGSGNLYFKGKATFTISGINTAGYEDIVLTFGVFGKNEGDINAMTLTINDGTTETTVSLADMNLDATAGTWSVATVSDIPATATLTLTFASTLDAADDGGIRLDDITITGIKTSDDGDDSGTGDGDTGDGESEEDTSIGAVNAASSSIVIAGRTITALNGSAEVFSLSGYKVATIDNGCATELPQGGVYIVKTGSQTVKAMLK